MLSALVVISALASAPAETALPEHVVQLFDTLPLEVRWQLVQEFYQSPKAIDKKVAEQLFLRFNDAEKKEIRRQFVEGRKRPSWVATIRHDTTRHDTQYATNLDKLETMRKKVLLYLDEVRRDTLAYQFNRSRLALDEINRFLDAYSLCKRDASPSHVDIACRRGEYCMKVLRSLYGEK